MRTLEAVMAELRELATKAAAGEDVSARRAQVEQELAKHGIRVQPTQAPAAQQLATTGAVAPALPALAPAFAPATLGADERQELDRLRLGAEQAQMAQLAAQFATLVETQQQTQQATQAQRMALALQEALGQKGLVPADSQNPMLQQAVMQVMAGTRAPSRFAGTEADAAVATQLATGQGVAPGMFPGLQIADQGSLQVGEDLGLKEIEDSKSLGRLMGILAKSHKNPWSLTEAEQKFLRKSSEKAMAQGTPSAGGYLVPQEWMPDILQVVRASAVVRRASPRVVPFNKQMNQTSISSGTTAYYTQENARIPVSEMTFAEAPILSPKYLTALVPVSNYLLGNAEGVDALVRDDMTSALATREDLAFLQGTGSGGEPTGFRNLSGVILNPINPGVNGFTPSLSDFRRIKGRTRLVGVNNPRWTWFFHPSLLTYLETLTDTTGRFLVDAGLLKINADGVSGTFDGLPFYASYQIPTALTLGSSTNATYVMLIDMSEAILGESVDLQIDVSSEATYSPDGGTTHISAFQQNQTVFRVIIGHDINHRAPSRGVIDQEGVLI